MSDRLRAFLVLAVFLPAALGCLLLAIGLASAFVGNETPDQLHAVLLIGQVAGLGWPCAVALSLLGGSRRKLGLRFPSATALLLTLALAAGLWTPLLAVDWLRSQVLADPEKRQLFERLVQPGWGGFPALLAVLAVAPGMMEELAFRGILLPPLARAWGGWPAVLVTAAAFAGFHLSAEQLVVQFLLGLVFGWLRLRTGSLWPCVLAHAGHNALTLGMMTWGPSWAGHQPGFPPLPWLAGGMLVAALAAWGLARLTRPSVYSP